MSNPLRDQISKLINDQIDFNRTSYTAQVVEYHHDTKTIDVKLVGFVHGASIDEERFREEKIKGISILSSSSIKTESLEPKDLVYIDFVNNDMSKAVLLSKVMKADSSIDVSGKDKEVSVLETTIPAAPLPVSTSDAKAVTGRSGRSSNSRGSGSFGGNRSSGGRTGVGMREELYDI